MLQQSFVTRVLNSYFSGMRDILLTLLFLFLMLPSFSQDLQGWLIYFGNTKIKDSKFSIHQEVQLRDYKVIGDHNQSLIRVGGQYQIKPYLVGTVGYGFIYTEAQGSPNNSFIENRIYQEALFSHAVKRTKVRHRLRLEERFIEHQDFRGRFRYSLFADIPLTARGFAKRGTYLALYDEVFVNISDDPALKAFDRNRAYAGFGYKLVDQLGLQLGYMRQNVGSQNGTNHVLLSFHHNLKLK